MQFSDVVLVKQKVLGLVFSSVKKRVLLGCIKSKMYRCLLEILCREFKIGGQEKYRNVKNLMVILILEKYLE